MVTHCIILSSSYSEGTRIAIDYCLKGQDQESVLIGRLDEITSKCGEDVSISTHYIQTENETWKSVCKQDAFFQDVKLISTTDEFIELIQKDRQLQGLDVAKYILSKIKCTHLKLEKLVYLCYAEYLCDKKKKLFTDNIYAFNLGPVVESVYSKYKGYEKTLPLEIAKKDIYNKAISKLQMPTRSRLLFAKDGIEKEKCIDNTLEKYGKYSASELVNLTHRDNTPWTQTYDGTAYKEILDSTIVQYHKYEIIN